MPREGKKLGSPLFNFTHLTFEEIIDWQGDDEPSECLNSVNALEIVLISLKLKVKTEKT